MKIRIDGRELVVRKSTIAVDAWQRQSGHGLAWLSEKENQIYGPAFAAFCALASAGLNPSWDELLLRDIDEFDPVPEPGDEQKEVAADAAVPPSLPAASSQVVDGEQTPLIPAAPASSPSS